MLLVASVLYFTVMYFIPGSNLYFIKVLSATETSIILLKLLAIMYSKIMDICLERVGVNVRLLLVYSCPMHI